METGSIRMRAAAGAAVASAGRTAVAPPTALEPPLAVLLREGFRWFMDRLNEDATASREPPLSAAAAIVVSHLDPRGSRAADVARSMGVSRQHVHAVVRELVDAGIVTAAADPTSRRDRVIAPTAEGERRRQRAVARLAALEAELAAVVGAEELARLRGVLARLWSPESTSR